MCRVRQPHNDAHGIGTTRQLVLRQVRQAAGIYKCHCAGARQRSHPGAAETEAQLSSREASIAVMRRWPQSVETWALLCGTKRTESAMATEFERLKCDIVGHSVMITSWYDDRLDAWRASAPAYAALFSERTGENCPPASRKAAIDDVINRLVDHFQTTPRL